MGYTNPSGWVMIFFMPKCYFFVNLVKNLTAAGVLTKITKNIFFSLPIPKIKFNSPPQGKMLCVHILGSGLKTMVNTTPPTPQCNLTPPPHLMPPPQPNHHLSTHPITTTPLPQHHPPHMSTHPPNATTSHPPIPTHHHPIHPHHFMHIHPLPTTLPHHPPTHPTTTSHHPPTPHKHTSHPLHQPTPPPSPSPPTPTLNPPNEPFNHPPQSQSGAGMLDISWAPPHSLPIQ